MPKRKAGRRISDLQLGLATVDFAVGVRVRVRARVGVNHLATATAWLRARHMLGVRIGIRVSAIFGSGL